MPTAATTLLQQRLTAVLNTGSGSCDETSAGRIEAVFAAANLPQARIVSVGPEDLEAALADAVATSDAVVVLGGDGTLRAAAIRCGAANVPLIPLPGGTMNMLPHALFGESSWEQALADTLAAPQLRDISGGLADGQPFYCAAILGAPSLWADARQTLRHGDLIGTLDRALNAIRHSHDDTIDYQLGDDHQGHAQAVAVICPLISRALADQAPSLEAAALNPETAAGLFRLAFHAVFDDWRRDQSIDLARVSTIRVAGHGQVPVILDGETVRMGEVVEITFQPRAFQAIAPAART